MEFTFLKSIGTGGRLLTQIFPILYMAGTAPVSKLGLRQLDPTGYQADNGAGSREDLIGLVNKGEPKQGHTWGSLQALALGSENRLRTLHRAQNSNG